MVVGVVSWELRIPGCRSLKDKRRVVRSLRDRLMARFRVSVAETGFQNDPARAELTAALVALDASGADSQLDRMDRFVASHAHAVVSATRRELL